MPPKTRRRTQEERSAETRRRLLNATIDLLIERGYARLTTADIARRAGVSNGARVHHFPTKEALVVAANKQAYADAIELGTQRARASKNPVRDLIEDLFSLYFGRFFLGSLDSVIAARTDRRLARHLHPIVAHYHAAMRAAWTKALRDAGYGTAEADEIYDIILGQVRGMALTSAWRPDPAKNARLIARVERILEASIPPPR
ncbi:MAG TPA: helix-turn-helix domain-containing protein [Alphaproteobacteria bacterium]